MAAKPWICAAMLVAFGSGCDADAPASSAPAPDAATTVPAATDLAASQITASTVTAPERPKTCDPGAIEVQPVDPGVDADQVINLINRGSDRCEVDVSSSPDAAANLEPNVVLAPGEVAHLWISELVTCEGSHADPAAEFELRVNGVVRMVPLTFDPGCGIELWALFTD